MPQATRTRKNVAAWALAATAVCAAALPTLFTSPRSAPAASVLEPSADPGGREGARLPGASALSARTGPIGRREGPADAVDGTADAAPGAAAPMPSFDEVYAQLVDLYAYAAGGGPTPNGALFGLEVQRLFGSLLERPNAGASLIAKLTPLPGDSAAIRDLCAFRVCKQGLGLALEKSAQEGDPDAMYALAGEVLATLPYSAKHAGDAAAILSAGSYMSAHHEALLLHLSQEAEGDLAFMAEPVIRLLLHLWDSNGLAVDGRLESLLALADGADPASRAAWVRLFQDEQARSVVLDRVMALGDARAIDRVGILAAVHLEPADSVRFLEEISRRGHRSHASGTAYFHVADKSLTELKGSYVDAQSDEALAEHRGNIVNAVGVGRGALESTFVEDVFRSDPSPVVRALAVQTLGSSGGAAFERAFEAALADPTLHGARESDILASALQNYVGSNQVDGPFVRSAAHRLLRVGTVSPNLREALSGYGAR